MIVRFNIPTDSVSYNNENSITSRDIENGQLRVTLNNKQHFPTEDCVLCVKYGLHQERKVQFRLGVDSRSHIIYVGSEFMKALRMKAGDQLRVSKVGEVYIFDKT